jgi:hypothetical protein
MKPPASKALVDARVNDLAQIILDGCELAFDLCAFVREKEQEPGSPWHLADGAKPLSESQIRRYRVKAEMLIGESCRASRKLLLRRHLARRRNLFAKAVNMGDVRAALACLHDEAELLGLYPPRKIAPTDPTRTRPYAPLSDADRLAARQTLYARVGLAGGGETSNGSAGPH